MSDRLALAIGKVILAWEQLDQTLHLALHALRPGNASVEEGRFAERRKLFRRFCAGLSGANEEFISDLDRFCWRLQILERKRGRIAHAWVTNYRDDGAEFIDVQEFIRRDERSHNFMTVGELTKLAEEIAAASADIKMLTVDASLGGLSRESRSALSRSRKRRMQDHQALSGPSTPSDTDKESR